MNKEKELFYQQLYMNFGKTEEIMNNKELFLQKLCISLCEVEEIMNNIDNKYIGDMKELTKIYKKYKKGEKLNKEELKFVYEIDFKIHDFGYMDPRLEEITSQRDKKEDLSYVFNCNKDEIAFAPERIKNRKIVYYYGDLFLLPLKNAKKLTLPKIIRGDLVFGPIRNAKNLVLPQSVNNVFLTSVSNLNDVELPKVFKKIYLANDVITPQNNHKIR